MNKNTHLNSKLSKGASARYVMVLLFLCLGLIQMQAQQDSQYTQYMYNTEAINPAYVGSRGTLSFTSLYRNQWVGLDGAPETLNFTVANAIGEHVGVGLSFVQDKIGPSNESILTMDFSYTLPFNDDGLLLSFGMKGGINLLDVDYSLLNIYNSNESVFQNNIDNRLTPIIGAGLYLYNDKWYAGVSVPNMLETTHYDDVTISNAKEKPNFYVIGGYVFELSDSMKFKPAVLGKFVQGAPVGVDVSANFLFSEKFTFGAAYRLDAAISALAGFQVSNQIFVGYSYDYDTTELGRYNSGSHEIFLRFEIFKEARRMINPRFF